MFDDSNDLQNQIDNILKTKKQYLRVVSNNRNIIDFGNRESPDGWWLEKNMNIWLQQFMIAQKTLSYDIRPKEIQARQAAQAAQATQGTQVQFNRSTK